MPDSRPPARGDATGAIRAGAVLFAWLVFGLLALGGVLALFGLPYREWLIYAAHAALFVLGPGALAYLCAVEGPVPPLTLLTQGFCLGLCLETLGYLALLMAGRPELIVWYPLPFAILLLARGRHLFARVAWSPPRAQEALAVLGVVLLVVFTTGVEVFDPVLNHHATWPVAYARAGLSRWPLPDPFTLGETVHYHYLYYLHFSVAALVTGQPFTLLVTRSAVPMGLAVLVLLLYDLAGAQTRRPALALLVPIQALVTVGYSSPVLFGWFGHVIAASSFHVPATLASHLVFFALLRELDSLVTPNRLPPGRLSLVAVMILAASGFRSSVLPVLGAAVAWLMLLSARKGKTSGRLFLVLGLILVSFALGLFVFFGFLGGNDATGVLRLAPLAPGNASDFVPYRWLASWGWPPRSAAAVTIVGSQIARLTFLLPGLVLFLVMAWRGMISLTPLHHLVMGAWLGGLAYVLLFYSTHGMGAFTQFGAIGAGLLAVGALDVLLEEGRSVRLRAVAAASFALFALHAGDVMVTVRSELARQDLASRNTEPVFFEPESDLAKVAREIRDGAFANTLFVVSGRSAGCRANAELRLAAGEPRFRLLASSRILRGYSQRRGVGEALREKADVLRRLGGPPENRWAAIPDAQRLLPAGHDLAVVDCGGGRALTLLPPGATVRLQAGGLSLVTFPPPSP